MDRKIYYYIYEKILYKKEAVIIKTDKVDNNFQIKCEKCGYDFSQLITMEGPKGTAKIGTCLNCHNNTYKSFEPNPNYKEPTNIYGISCPFCQSTNVKKISGTSKVASAVAFGVFALGKVSKTWHCNNCRSNFG